MKQFEMSLIGDSDPCWQCHKEWIFVIVNFLVPYVSLNGRVALLSNYLDVWDKYDSFIDQVKKFQDIFLQTNSSLFQQRSTFFKKLTKNVNVDNILKFFWEAAFLDQDYSGEFENILFHLIKKEYS